MNTTRLLIILAFFGAASTLFGQTERMNPAEMSLLINFLNTSLEDTEKTLELVDDELWNHIPQEGGWRISECVEHILIAEQVVFEQVKESLTQPENSQKSLRRNDALVISRTVDRGKKVKTPLEPQTIRTDKSGYLELLRSSRKEIIEFFSSHAPELRSHFGRAPFGEVDAYQLGLVIAGHNVRHISQIKEIIAKHNGEEVSY